MNAGKYIGLLLLGVVLLGCNENGESPYMWHPGQLAAWNQSHLLKKSKERCVNVGYPGNFYKKDSTACFKAEFSAVSPMDVNVVSEGECQILLDGEVLTAGNLIPAGDHTLDISVRTSGRLPAVKIIGQSPLTDPGLWKASLNGEDWLPVEFDPKERKGLRPDDDQEVVRELRPDLGEVSLDKGDTLLVDFKEDELGCVEFIADGTATIHMIVGESRSEALSGDTTGFEQRALDDMKIDGRIQVTLPERALRYLSIEADGPCTFSDFVFKTKIWPVEPLLAFKCDDEDLNRLFEASVRTQLTSLHGGFSLDGIKRDFLPWAMDGVASSLSLDYLLQDRQVGRNGISVALLPPCPAKEDIGVTDYPLHGILGLEEDYLCYGDLSTWHLYRDRALSQAALYESLQDERGFISSDNPEWGFITGWDNDNGPSRTGTPCYAQMLLMRNYQILAFFLQKDGDTELSAHYQSKAVELEDAIRAHFLDDATGAYVNGYFDDGTLDTRLSHHTQYWGILSGMLTADKGAEILENIVLNLPHYKENVSYEKGYEALAWARCGKCGLFTDEMLKTVFLRWLDSGHTRFPENLRVFDDESVQLEFYDRPYGLSLCHGANGAPVLVTVLYGILGLDRDRENPLVPVFKPCLMNLNHLEASVPLPGGKLIEMNLDSKGKSTVKVPAGVSVRFCFKGKDRLLEGGKTYLF